MQLCDDVKSTSWCQRVCHDIKKYAIMSKSRKVISTSKMISQHQEVYRDLDMS